MDFFAHDIGVAAMRFERAMASAVSRSLLESGLSVSEYGVLDHIRSRPDVSTADLARYLLVTPQSLGRITKRLLERGLVTRSFGLGKRRPLSPTPLGETLYSESRPIIEQTLRQLFRSLEKTEQENLLRMLTTVADAAEG